MTTLLHEMAAARRQEGPGHALHRRRHGHRHACQKGIAQVEADLGPVDVLVNNAGITRDGMFHKHERRRAGRR